MPPPPVVRRDTTPESTPEQPIQSANCRRNDPGMTGSPPEPTPASAQHPPIPRMPRPPADEQARQFLAWLKARYGGERVFASHLKKQLYPSFCAQKGWQPRPWNTLAEDLKELTGGRKNYEWVERDCELHRLRIYRIPSAQVVQLEQVQRLSA
jgi:hypothetical protein